MIETLGWIPAGLAAFFLLRLRWSFPRESPNAALLLMLAIALLHAAPSVLEYAHGWLALRGRKAGYG